MATLKVLGSLGLAFTRFAATPQTLVAGTHGAVVYDNGAVNGVFTLPAANALGAGYSQTIWIANHSTTGTLTLTPAGTDVFYGLGVGSASSKVIPPGSDVLLFSDGGASSPGRWYVSTESLGPVTSAVRSVTSAAGTTVLDTTDHVAILTGSTTHTFTLPACFTGRSLRIKNRSTGALTVNRAGSDTIDGGTSITLTTNQAADLMGNGTDWSVL